MASILKVDTIQDQSGNNIINENADTITIGASGDTVNVVGTLQNNGNNAVGITMADQWRLTADKTGNSDITANWERDDTYNPGLIGTGMTESSGIFSFPSTGIYQIDFWTYLKNPGATAYAGIYVSATTDNSSYNIAAEFVTSISAANYFNGGYSSYLFDVTDISNCKVKFTTAAANSNTIFVGNTNINYTGAQFKRLGDT